MPVSGKKSPPDTDDIGLPLPQIGGIQPLHFDLVEFGAFDQITHPLKFQLVGRHKQLPACFKGDTVVPAKLLGGFRAASAKIGFQTARGVVNPRVYDAGTTVSRSAASSRSTSIWLSLARSTRLLIR